MQEAAKAAVEAIRSNSPAPVELDRLREELERLKSANVALQERLDRFERKSDKRVNHRGTEDTEKKENGRTNRYCIR